MKDFLGFWWDCLVVAWTAFNNLSGVVLTISGIVAGLLLFRQRTKQHVAGWEDTTKKIVSGVFLLSLIAAIFVSPYILYKRLAESTPTPQTITDRPLIDMEKVQLNFKPQFTSIEMEVAFTNYGNRPAKETETMTAYLFTEEELTQAPNIEFDPASKSRTIHMPNSGFRSIHQISRTPERKDMYDALISNAEDKGHLYLYGKVRYTDGLFVYEYSYFCKYLPNVGVFKNLNTSESISPVTKRKN